MKLSAGGGGRFAKTPLRRPLPSRRWWKSTSRSRGSMLVLDENLPEDQCVLLRRRGIHVRVVGVEVSALGTDDKNLIPLLHRLPRPTFFTLDRDFFRQDWTHTSY